MAESSVPLLMRCQQLQLLYQVRIGLPRLIKRRMQRIAQRSTPILLGPWLSEVGFELLYWIPFVRHLFQSYKIDPRRVVAISRGGAAPWYRELAGQYFEIFDCLSPQEFLAENHDRELRAGIKKQMSIGALDERLLHLAADRLDLTDYEVIHPHWMYTLFSGYWRGWMHMGRLCSWCDHSRLAVDLPRPKGLPFTGDYAAVKFYFSECFPDTPANRSFIQCLLDRLAERLPVVLLNTGIQVDDHRDVDGRSAGAVFDATPLMTSGNNLEVQTALVANARFLVSTYGGFSYLGPMLGKRTISFYSTTNFIGSHLQVAHEVLNTDPDAFLAVLPTAAWRLVMDMAL